MHWRQLTDRDFLGSWDLVGPDGCHKDFTLEIASVKSELLKSREVPKGKRKVVVRFKGARKAWVGNTTCCETIETMYGPDVDAWVGKRITLYATDVRSPKGGTIKGVRVRPRAPGGPATELPEVPVDESIRAKQDEAFGREPEEG